MGRVVLVTGVSGEIGGRFARRLVEDPLVERVIGVDVVPPRGDMGRVGFVRADIRNPVIAKVITGQDVDTVVHLSLQPGTGSGGRLTMKEHNVIGSMQLLAACQKAPSLERVVLRSSAEVYGSSSRDPAMFTEEMGARGQLRSGFARDVLEVEGYARGFSRRRPDVSVTTLRAAETLGAGSDSPLARYLRLPVVPTVAGFDPRLQVLHETDLLDAVHQVTLGGVHGTFNLAGAGVLMLSQALRRLGRATVGVPGFALGTVGTVARRAGIAGLAPELQSQLTFGRGLDTTRMRTVLGFTPRYTTQTAFHDFAAALAPSRIPPARALLTPRDGTDG